MSCPAAFEQETCLKDIYMCMYVCIYIYMCVCVCVCLYIHIYIYTYIYIHTYCFVNLSTTRSQIPKLHTKTCLKASRRAYVCNKCVCVRVCIIYIYWKPETQQYACMHACHYLYIHIRNHELCM
jgi:hypothetical protein